MKNSILFTAFFGSLLLFSCSKDEIEELTIEETVEETNDEPDDVTSDPDPLTEQETIDLEIKDFIYRGLNDIYLYKADTPELADGYFENDSLKNQFLEKYDTPEILFNSLLSNKDRFSFIVDDYEALEDRFDGVSGATGMDFGLAQIQNTNNVIGFIQYILPETSAEREGLKRGDIFTEVNGQQLTTTNFSTLLNQASFTINVGYIENDRIVITDKTADLTDDRYTMNPVLISKVLEIDNRKIGYIMYTSFIADFDDELNAAFGDLKSKGITDLVLDLRYNGGGSVASATSLASMVTGQFTNEVFATEIWNDNYQEYYENVSPSSLINKFKNTIRTGETINSLNLSQVYILTSNSTASASELIINGLNPYIDVVQIGTTTTGKFQASVTLYDSPNFNKSNINQNHNYAMQPLVLKMANKLGNTDYEEGLTPDINIREDIRELGELGNENEPLLSAAIDKILNRTTVQLKSKHSRQLDYQKIGETNMLSPTYQRMYIDNVPFE
ncbi:S41 family peptidase [Zunongwangia sp.]|uniref:S41 family peptidase n=1 Tax=Zunongwangia sp. TaxID=1965325 RepID=UPI003AA7CAC4